MSKESIYAMLKSAGLTKAGACALMGNMMAESALRSNNVQDGMGYSDEAYTRDVDCGIINRESFATDSRGYGLCQWTYNSRKRNLYDYALNRGASIGDEAMQVEFCINEMKCDYHNIWNQCCSADFAAMEQCSHDICERFENPAVKNYGERYKYAKQLYESFYSVADDISQPVSCENEQSTDSCDITVRILRNGDSGRDVLMLQTGLTDCGFELGKIDGIFGGKTLRAVRDFQKSCNLEQTGVADQSVWQILFQ